MAADEQTTLHITIYQKVSLRKQDNIPPFLPFRLGKCRRRGTLFILMTEQQAQNRLATLCAKGEHCTQEMLEKLRKWEIDDEAQARIMAYLTTHHFVDDARFCEAFIKDKIEFNGWGRRKVEQALYLKGIPRSLSDPFFEEIPDEMYLEKLRPLIQHKWPTIKGRNDYERSMKLMKYALGRGFDMRLVRLCIEEIGESLDD